MTIRKFTPESQVFAARSGIKNTPLVSRLCRVEKLAKDFYTSDGGLLLVASINDFNFFVRVGMEHEPKKRIR